MQNPENSNFNDQLRDRTLALSVMIHDLFDSKKINLLNRPMVQQIVRSSSSMAANYRSATRARSDGEFYSKICIVVEECDETQFWLEYLTRIRVLADNEVPKARSEVDQLLRLFSSIKKKMKEKQNLKG
jgi:four helix bundle protein